MCVTGWRRVKTFANDEKNEPTPDWSHVTNKNNVNTVNNLEDTPPKNDTSNALHTLREDTYETPTTSVQDKPINATDDSKTQKQESVNTENIEVSVTRNTKNDNDMCNQIKDVNTQNTAQIQVSLSTKDTDGTEPTRPNEDWSSLMFSSDDSLFEEWTRQMEDNNNIDPSRANNVKSPASTATSMAASSQHKDTLPDIVLSGKKSDAITGLLMLGENPEHLDDEINNELIMPVNKPKQPDIIEEETKKNKCKNKKDRKTKKTENQNDSPRKLIRQSTKHNSTHAKTTEFPSLPKNPGSPRGVLKVTRYELRKGNPNTYVAKLLKCSVCDQIVKTKNELRSHHQEVHNIITCKDCGKGFATKQSLRKHTYTHTTMTNYECILCKKFFVFPSELDAYMVIHDTLPNFSCNIVGCKNLFQKSRINCSYQDP